MDLASEIAESDFKERRKPGLDSLTEDANSFCKFLLDNGCKLQEADPPRPRVTGIYQDEFSAVFLPPSATTPFHDFTGTDQRATVVFTEAISTSSDLANETSVDAQSPVATPPHTLWESPANSTLGNECHGPEEPFCTTWQKTVNIGQQLSIKRVFLNRSVPLHNGQTAQPSVSTELTFSHATTPLPVSLARARYLCSLYALGARSLPHPLPTMWVVCRSDLPRKVVAMGCSFADSVLHTYTISEEDSVQASPQGGGSAGHTLEKGKRRSFGKISRWAFSEYEISSSSKELASSGYGQLVLQFAWTDPDVLLSPPPESANAVLRIAATPGGMFSPVLSVYQELSTLLSLCKIASGQAEWPGSDQEGSLEAPLPLGSQVESFLEETSSPQFQPLEVTVISPTADHTVYQPRTDLDFVEQLWMFCKEVQSFDDLQQIFAAVFKAVLLNKVQPFLHRSSSSLLSSMFRQVLRCTNKGERQTLAAQLQSLLSESKLPTCLVQIGLEKLQRDYRSFFVGSDLLTGSQLDQFFGSTSAPSLLEQCHSLRKLHNVLELNAATLTFLNLPTSSLSSLTKVALEVYRTSSIDPLSPTTPIFHLPLPAYSQSLKSVVALCSNLSPSKWSVASQDEQLGVATGGRNAGCATTVTLLQNCPLFGEDEIKDGSGQFFRYKSFSDYVTM